MVCYERSERIKDRLRALNRVNNTLAGLSYGQIL